jgi:exodeoxyribonuclease VII large subunit
MTDVTLGVSEALSLINTTLDAALPFMIIEGEVASFKINKQKFVFFDIKDEECSLGCFMMVFYLKFPLEDGMKVRVVAQPKLTNWGKFSLTVHEVMPVGEGSLKKSFELLKAKLEKEGLFDEHRKRALPEYPKRIGVVSSSQAAGFGDFIKILDHRWGGLEIILADVQVQGLDSPAQIVGGIEHLNNLGEPLDVLAVIRGGGSADDLAAFNHEDVVRAIAGSRTPVVVGVGHEVDISLCDLAADVRAATPSNAAQLIVPDKENFLRRLSENQARLTKNCEDIFSENSKLISESIQAMGNLLETTINHKSETIRGILRTLTQLNPQTVLKRGYSLVRKNGKILTNASDVTIGEQINITLAHGEVEAKVNNASS